MPRNPSVAGTDCIKTNQRHTRKPRDKRTIPSKHYKPLVIVARMRKADALLTQGEQLSAAAKLIRGADTKYLQCRSECGEPKLDQVNRLKKGEAEHALLRR